MARIKGFTQRRKTGRLADVSLGNKKQQLPSADHEKEKNWAKMFYPTNTYFTDRSNIKTFKGRDSLQYRYDEQM